jgi:acyl-CoA synthetase (AMP-forming)/AMP-acid ligase II
MAASENWNFGDIFEALDEVMPPDATALIHDGRELKWGEFASRTNNLARALLERGAQPNDKIAFYMRNCTEYLETLVAAFKARLVHVNVNFRYLDDELAYILDNSDAKFVVFGPEFADRAEGLSKTSSKVTHWIQVGAESGAFAEAYDSLANVGDGSPLRIDRSTDDLLFIYTGGTTGMPKGVMWRAEDLWGALGYGANSPANVGTRPETQAEHIANVAKYGPGPRQIVACPLMHGTGMLTSISALAGGASVITMAGASFDSEEMFDVVDRFKANSMVIVGDAFARPMLKVLQEHPGRWSFESLQLIISSGVMWSREIKMGMLEHLPNTMLADMFGSSEAVGFGSSVTSKKGGDKTAKFAIGENCKVFSEDHREILPGSGERGFIARRGPIPLGYYKDEEKTAKTFPTIDGVRYSIPGDWCTVEEDGTLTLLGRGSACINTAGEKVYPEEIEEALKTHGEVEDALVIGLPDEKWGQAVTAVVELRAGGRLDEDALRAHVRGRLAGYKTPKRIFCVETMFRGPNGKADYKSATEFARRQSGEEAT